MGNKAPKLRLIQGGKQEPKYSIRLDLALIILGVLFIAMLIYKATYYEY